MEELKQFLDNVEGIRRAVEKIAFGGDIEISLDTSKQAIEVPVAQPMPTNQVTTPVASTVVPTTVQAESFTQDQIAVAMSNALAAGRKDVVDKILTTFNAQCLMQIDKANYNQIAVMLREAGIQI